MGFMKRIASWDDVQTLRSKVEYLQSEVDELNRQVDKLSAVNRRLEQLQELHCVSDDKLHMLAKHMGLRFATGTRIEKMKED